MFGSPRLYYLAPLKYSRIGSAELLSLSPQGSSLRYLTELLYKKNIIFIILLAESKNMSIKSWQGCLRPFLIIPVHEKI